MRRISSLLHVFALLLAAPLSAQVVAAKHARVELISREASIARGHDLTLGVHFMLEKGWHIYWINPGDSGQPPSLQWQLPAGFNAGETQWPRPAKWQSSPTLADYGYHDDVLLIVPVREHGEVADKSLEAAVQAKWLICREVCIPDHAQLKLTVPHGTAGTNPGTARLFTSAEKQLPKPWPRSWTAMAESRKEDFLLTIKTGKPVSKAEFYPLDAGQIQNAAPQRVKATPHGCTMVLKKSDLLLKPVAALRGVLVLGNGQAYALRVPMNSQAALLPEALE
jgi:DsbC/DsbD-like thiol-disulfide interchange protein